MGVLWWLASPASESNILKHFSSNTMMQFSVGLSTHHATIGILKGVKLLRDKNGYNNIYLWLKSNTVTLAALTHAFTCTMGMSELFLAL